MKCNSTPGLVSTIVPVYNRAGLLRKAVQSVVDQTYRPVEVIIVDDGSTDGTSAAVDELAGVHPEVRCLHVENGGAGRAREAGRRIARGEFIQYLDSDDLLLPRKFEIQVGALRAQPECDIAYGYMRLVTADGHVLRAPSQWTGKTFETLLPALLVDRWWGTHTPLYRRLLLDRVGPWSDMRRGEDWEYEARVAALGPKLVHCHEFVCDDVQHEQERLTGTFGAAEIPDAGRLLVRLRECASQAGVPLTSPEMMHFSRYAFLMSRWAGAHGLPDLSAELFTLARNSTVPECRNGLGFRIYGALAHILGWRIVGSLSCVLDSCLKRKPRAHTLHHSRVYK